MKGVLGGKLGERHDVGWKWIDSERSGVVKETPAGGRLTRTEQKPRRPWYETRGVQK